MPGFERTKRSVDLLAELLRCANPQCLQESDQLQHLGTACKHAFCWDCINSYSKMDTLVLCPLCSCPLDVHRPKAAQIFNNIAQHLNEFKLLLREYERALSAADTESIEQTQKLFQTHEALAVDKNDQAARDKAIKEFISSQKLPDADNDDDVESILESEFSEELNETPPPQLRLEVTAAEHVELEDSFTNSPYEEIAAKATTSGMITDSLPQLGAPVMTSTQQTNLFLTQAVHSRNDIFEDNSNQEIKTYRSEKLYNYFSTKPKNTFDKRERKVDEAPWMNIPDKKHSPMRESAAEEKCDNNISSTQRGSSVTPKRGPKVENPSNSRARRSSSSTPKAHVSANDPVIAAVVDGKLENVQDAVEAGYDVNQRDDKKRTPLFIAVEMERLDICQFLIERGGAVINANCGSDCNTALHIAVSRGNEAIVKYLLSKGASKTIRNIRQETPSQLAQPHSPLRLLVEKYRTHPRQPLVARLPDVHIVCIDEKISKTLSYDDQSVIGKLMTIVGFCDEETTHYVVSTDANGVANVDALLLRAMMQNTRIVTVRWLNECMRVGKALPHTRYEVSKLLYMESEVISDSLSRCTKSKEKMEPGLFHGCTFYFLVNKCKGIDDRHLLRDLIRLGGGEISRKEPVLLPNAPAPFHAPHLSSPLFVVYDVTATKDIPSVFHRHPTNYNLVPAEWIIECVARYSIMPIS